VDFQQTPKPLLSGTASRLDQETLERSIVLVTVSAAAALVSRIPSGRS
jgi:hypothetical protein